MLSNHVRPRKILQFVFLDRQLFQSFHVFSAGVFELDVSEVAVLLPLAFAFFHIKLAVMMNRNVTRNDFDVRFLHCRLDEFMDGRFEPDCRTFREEPDLLAGNPPRTSFFGVDAIVPLPSLGINRDNIVASGECKCLGLAALH